MTAEPNGPCKIRAFWGKSAHRPALVGFAPAFLLSRLSKADVLDEATGRGYQRRFSDQHSLDFRRYIQRDGSTTIPLTFNLRPSSSHSWRIDVISEDVVELVTIGTKKILAQVDCQHRLGHIEDLDLQLPFLIYINLSEMEEMAVFKTINSKAKGLSGSLMDYHDTRLAADLARERPELLIALHLNEAEMSPWRKQLDLGGNPTSGLRRRASLRTMQKAVKRFLMSTEIIRSRSVPDVAEIVLSFWIAISNVLREQWHEPRRHFLTKGIGVYSLMGILGDICTESLSHGHNLNIQYFTLALNDFAVEFDWSATGPMQGLGGEAGAQAALEILRKVRMHARPKLELVHG